MSTSEHLPLVQHVQTDVLDIAYEQWGPPGGTPLVLLHGFPYSPRAFDDVAPALAAAGHRVIVPYLRGFGATRFRSDASPRSGQQGAIGADVIDLIDALGLAQPLIAGFDWGGRAACVAAALWPEKIGGLAVVGGYLIQDIAEAMRPLPPALEHRFWYMFYFCTERGRRALAEQRDTLCGYLWQQWSPHHPFDAAAFARSAAAFDNPDFVEVAIHSYRHRLGLAPGDPHYAEIERRLAARPPIRVPTMVLTGANGRQSPGETIPQLVGTTRIPEAGHNPFAETPAAATAAILALADVIG
ncbi:MAG: putative Hydrolase, alpha/beta fold family [Sphingomonas bacterium]|nr:putative Hydrolase, alpha/beta fold family [Sphingomonas bacterium]